MNIFEAIKKRYSYRGRFKSTPVPRNELKLIMETGLVAPSGCHKQTTSLIGIDDPELINSIMKMLNKNGFIGGNPPAGICVLSQPYECYPGVFFNVQDYSAAIENMLLAIVALGYDSCWIEGHIVRSVETQEQISKLLNIPEGYVVVGFLPVGIVEAEGKRAVYKPFEERAWFNGFGRNK
jgi:nitroreductase